MISVMVLSTVIFYRRWSGKSITRFAIKIIGLCYVLRLCTELKSVIIIKPGRELQSRYFIIVTAVMMSAARLAVVSAAVFAAAAVLVFMM